MIRNQITKSYSDTTVQRDSGMGLGCDAGWTQTRVPTGDPQLHYVSSMHVTTVPYLQFIVGFMFKKMTILFAYHCTITLTTA